MAYINGKFLEKEERNKLLKELEVTSSILTDQIDTLTTEELDELDLYLNQIERIKRVNRSEEDLLYFCWEYFSDLRNPDGMGNGNWTGFDLETPEKAAKFHKQICGMMDNVSLKEKNAKIAVAAPRGHAKSSYLSKGNPLREIVFRKRKYLVIISQTPLISEQILSWIGYQLKGNKKLREDFGELLSPKQQLNSSGGGKDNNSEFTTWEAKEDGMKKILTVVFSASTNQAIRGMMANGRPDMVILDDLEGIHTNAGTPEQRKKLKEWFSSDVMPLGDAKGEITAYTYMGTIVHQDSLLNGIINDDPEFKSIKFKALINQPERLDLWEDCREIYNDKNLEKEKRKLNAMAFYKKNKREMNKGSKVLWPEVQDMWKLMTWKWSKGSKAFSTEYQNEPRDEESQIFFPESFPKYKPEDLDNGKFEYYSFWDVATGENLKKTDFNAIVTVAKNIKSGAFHVVNVWGAKCKLTKALDQAVHIIQRFEPKEFGVEAIGASWDTPRQLEVELKNQEGYHRTRIRSVKSHSERNKNLRIATMEPLIEKGFLLFLGNEALLNEQMEQFPGGTNDDFPDALASVIELAGGIRTKRITSKRKPRGF